MLSRKYLTNTNFISIKDSLQQTQHIIQGA